MLVEVRFQVEEKIIQICVNQNASQLADLIVRGKSFLGIYIIEKWLEYCHKKSIVRSFLFQYFSELVHFESA